MQEVLDQRRKLQFGKQRASSSRIGLLRAHGFRLEFDRDIRLDGRELLAQQDGVAIVLQRLAIGLALDFLGVLQRVLHAAKPLDQLHRPFVADAGCARNIVDGIAAQRHHVHDLVRRHAQDLFHLGSVADEVVLGRVQHASALADQLHHVLVAGDHKHRIARVRRLPRQGANHVVGLEAGGLDHGDAIRLQRAPDVRHLLH